MHWKAAEQYFTFGKFISFGLGSVRSKRVKEGPMNPTPHPTRWGFHRNLLSVIANSPVHTQGCHLPTVSHQLCDAFP